MRCGRKGRSAGMENRMEIELRYALLIDADNISSRYIDIIIREAKMFGNVTVRRIYGDWTSCLKNSWKDCLLDNSLSPIQQYSYTTGKNSSDFAMIIDAMDILYSGNVDGFVIVSSDSDFTKLAMRLREAGMSVIGMGESKTPTPFVRACEQFKTLDVLYKNASGGRKKQKSEERMSIEELRRPRSQRNDAGRDEQSKEEAQQKATEEAEPITKLKAIKSTILSILDENSDEDGWMYLAELGNMVQRTYSDFDCRNYGFSKFGRLVEAFPEIQIRKDDSSNGITKIVLVKRKDF